VEVEQRFQPRTSSGTIISYQVDHIEAIIAYQPDGRVGSIDLPAAVEIKESDLIAKYGSPDRTRLSERNQQELDYDAIGLTIFVFGDPAITRRVRLRVAQGSVRASSEFQVDELVPIRPPLVDLQARRSRVASALGEIAPQAPTTGSADEQEVAEQTYGLIRDRGLLIREPDLHKYMLGLTARLTSVTPDSGAEWRTGVMQGSVPQGMNLGAAIFW